MIATPAYGDIFYTPYVQSLIKLVRGMHQKQWDFSFRSISYSEISESRNYLLTHWLDKTDASHILFLDADMGFEPQQIVDMVAFDKPVVGAVYPKRNIDLRRVAKHAAESVPADIAIARAQQFVFRPPREKGEWNSRDGFLEVEACGAGILLIQRTCIETMLRLMPQISDTTAKKTSPLAKELDRLIRAFDILHVGGSRLSEDYSFCHRWKHLCKGEIWASIAHEIVHIGLHQFKGRYADTLPVAPGQSVTGRLGILGSKKPQTKR
jgi:hypothetical protein